MSYETMRDKYFNLLPAGHYINRRVINNQRIDDLRHPIRGIKTTVFHLKPLLMLIGELDDELKKTFEQLDSLQELVFSQQKVIDRLIDRIDGPKYPGIWGEPVAKEKAP